jgi:putative methyltransferase (TIGR04325 family)
MSGFDSKSLRRLVRRLLPPVVHDALKAIRQTEEHGFHGRYENFAEALSAAGGPGYESPELINSVREGTLKVQALVRAEPRRTRDLWVMQNLAAILHALGTGKRSRLHVLDFGGGMGVHYLTLRHLLPVDHEVRWTVCETRAAARTGHEHFANEELDFIDDLDRVGSPVDLVFASGALQYTEAPSRYFERLASLASHVVLNRTPFINAATDVLTLQSVTRDGYAVRLPVWLLSSGQWLDHFKRAGLTIALRWQEDIDSGVWENRPISFEGIVGTR